MASLASHVSRHLKLWGIRTRYPRPGAEGVSVKGPQEADHATVRISYDNTDEFREAQEAVDAIMAISAWEYTTRTADYPTGGATRAYRITGTRPQAPVPAWATAQKWVPILEAIADCGSAPATASTATIRALAARDLITITTAPDAAPWQLTDLGHALLTAARIRTGDQPTTF